MKSKKSTKIKSQNKPKEDSNQNNNSLSLLNSSIKEVLTELGYEKLTKVQEKMIKEILNKNNPNIICKSPKGSGKMLSFLLPLINKIIENEKKNIMERFIIISGMKERVHELYSLAKELLRDINGNKICLCVGGISRKKENLKLMQDEIKLIISTPQRIVEYLKNDKKKKLVINKNIKTIIFDEVDNMQKNGYLNELKNIVNFFASNENINFILYCQNDDNENDINKEEQLNNNNNKTYINELINISKRKYNIITIKESEKNNNNNSELKNKLLNPKITKRGYIILDPAKKFLFLLSFLRKNLKKKILIFFSTPKEVIFYNSLLNLYHIETLMVYSSSSRGLKENKESLNNFIIKENGFLLSTNLSKMKLNIPLCDWILFYDSPEDIETFEENLEINCEKNLINKISEIKAFMILMPNEVDLLKEKKEININEFNLNIGSIDKDQEKVEKMVNTKQQNVLVNAFEAYKEFLFNYASRNNKEIFNIDDIDVTKLCKSFGFKHPPYVNFSSLLNYEEKKKNKKNFLFPDEIEKIYGKAEE